MLITLVPAALSSTRVTRPSAGDTTTSGSEGGTRFGSRKKNAMKSVTTRRNAAIYQKPSTAVATAITPGTKMYGMLSLTINVCLPATKKHNLHNKIFVLRGFHLCSLSLYVKGDAYSIPRPLQSFSSEKLPRAVSVTQALRSLVLQHH